MNSVDVVLDAVLTVDQAAVFLKCGPKAIRRLVRLKRIPARKVDLRGSLRFSRAALEQWLREAK